MFKVRKPILLLVAGALWLIAGINILRIGINAFAECYSLGTAPWYLLLIGALVIFAGFSMMFRRIVKKHQQRILGYQEEKKSVFYCFDRKGYLLMIFMMTLGIVLRTSNLLPNAFFAVFYNGLGGALCLGGSLFAGCGVKHLGK